MSDIEQILQTHLKKNGYISIKDFMSLCLTHPEYGYYIKNNPLGRGGDFTTAPEMSQIFGEIWGVFLAYHLDKIAPDGYYLCEAGAGRGTLMSDILRILPKKPTHIYILESNRYLKVLQKEKLLPYKLPITHIGAISEIPTDKPVVFIANEFFDALPISVFVGKENERKEVNILYEEEKGYFFSEALENVREESETSCCFMKEIAELIKKTSGLGLFCDYGYEVPLNRLTFRGYYKHQVTDGLSQFGESDLTADVDFSALTKVVINEECFSYPLLTQKQFLEALHIHIYAEKLLKNMKNEQQKHLLQTALNKLLSVDEMGEKFKFLCIVGKEYQDLYPFI